MNNINAQAQLAYGFYDLENSSWRWTASRFGVLLEPPQKGGADLVFEFSIPGKVIHDNGSTTLIASANGKKIRAQRYTVAGSQQFSAHLPANLLSKAPVRIDFSLDAYFPAGAVEARELGVIATSVGLQNR